MSHFDLILVGGGLQNALIALAVFAMRPHAHVAIVEAASKLGGEHTWCFHAGDLSPFARAFVEPLVAARWPRWEVRFPRLHRTFDAEYACVTAERLDQVLRASPAHLVLGRAATEVSAHRVVIGDSKLTADLVVDARGPRAMNVPVAWQKFVGLEVELERDLEQTTPIVMDAEVEQLDGFRFLYVLPFDERRVLLEDTYFSLDPRLDEPAITERIFAYARDLRIARIVRRERGALPLPLVWKDTHLEHPLIAGYAGGFFHPTTGYSFPVAARVAERVARGEPIDVARHDRQARYAVLLNRLLFWATAAPNRRDVLERFHRLPEDVVRRFYALDTTPSDRLRILCGMPPPGVSLRKALTQVMSS